MSILNRLNRIIRSNVTDIRTGGQSGSIDRAVGEMETSLKEARRQRARLRQQEKKLIAAIRRSRDKADEWEERAMMALKRNAEDLARDALIARNDALDEAARLREELEEQRRYMQDIESALEALEMKLEGTRSKLRASSPSRSSRRISDESEWDAEFRRRVQGRSGDSGGSGASSGPSSERRRQAGIRSRSYESEESFDTDKIFSEMDRMGSKIDEYTAEVEAMRELSDENLRDPGRTRLEERFRDLEGRSQTRELKDRAEREDRGDYDRDRDNLADLKKKFED